MSTDVGLYVHVPFCRQLCPYCDFAVAVRKQPPHDPYCDALLRELETRDELACAPVTVYFGGGTPAMFAPDALARFLDAVDVTSAREMTIEANPHDITPDRLELWHELGFDRVSLGVQSFDDAALRGLGRDHDGQLARQSAEQLVRDGRFRISLDLIYGGPHHDRTVLDADLDVLADLRPEHVSAYELTIETDTVFGRKQRAGTLELPRDDDVIDIGFELVDRLTMLGYERYEVSSFARDEHRALHNSGYWLGRPYIGLGTGAHSMHLDDGVVVRRANQRNLNSYLADPLTPAELEHLDAADALGERLMLACRTTLGVQRKDLDLGPFETSVVAVWDELRERGMLADGTALAATPAGLDAADAIAQRFWDATHPGD